jgi:hypothetical protein
MHALLWAAGGFGLGWLLGREAHRAEADVHVGEWPEPDSPWRAAPLMSPVLWPILYKRGEVPTITPGPHGLNPFGLVYDIGEGLGERLGKSLSTRGVFQVGVGAECGPDPRQTSAYARWRECVYSGTHDCGHNPGSNEAHMDWLMCRWQNQDPSLIRELQSSLGIATDGVVGRATRAALARRQATWGLPATGMMDVTTMENFILGG